MVCNEETRFINTYTGCKDAIYRVSDFIHNEAFYRFLDFIHEDAISHVADFISPTKMRFLMLRILSHEDAINRRSSK